MNSKTPIDWYTQETIYGLIYENLVIDVIGTEDAAKSISNHIAAHVSDVDALVTILERCENHLHACSEYDSAELLEDLQGALAAYREKAGQP